MIDTFSANSLKILDNSKEEFIRKYIDKNELLSLETEDIKRGNKFHNLICYYLKNFEINKFEESLSDFEKELFNKIKNSPLIEAFKNADKKFVEYPFYILEKRKKEFYLTGRFDALYSNKDKAVILDWKIKNLPKNADDDIQTLVYTYACSKMFNTKNVEIVYYSIFEGIEKRAFLNEDGINKIENIILKLG